MSHFNRIARLLPVAAGITLLASCGKADHGGPTAGATVGVSESFSSASDTALGREFSRLRKLSNSRDASATVTVDSSSVVDAAIAFVPPGRALKKVTLGLQGANTRLINRAEDASNIAVLLADADPFKGYLLEVAAKAETAKAVAVAGAPALESLLNEANDVLLARSFYSLAVTGATGWEVAPPMPFGPQLSSKDKEAAALMFQSYMRSFEIGGCTASRLGGSLASEMASAVLPNAEAAARWAAAMSLTLLKSSAHGVLQECARDFPIDAARTWNGRDSSKVSWWVTGSDGKRVSMECSGDGCAMLKITVPQFGKGYYADGLKYSLQYAHSTSSSAERSSSSKQSESTKQSSSSEGKAGIGN